MAKLTLVRSSEDFRAVSVLGHFGRAFGVYSVNASRLQGGCQLLPFLFIPILGCIVPFQVLYLPPFRNGDLQVHWLGMVVPGRAADVWRPIQRPLAVSLGGGRP